MAPTPPLYRRIPGRSRRPFGYDSLWLADDHLLLAERRAYSETYRRFYFRDIQGFALRRTPSRWIWASLLASGLLAFVLIALASSEVARIVLFTLAGVCGAGVLIHLLRGPTCVCRLATAIQTADLPLRRERRALRVIAQLDPRIEREQGRMGADELAAGAAQEPAPLPSPRVRTTPPPLPVADRGLWHLALFLLLLIDAGVTTLQLRSSATALTAAATVLFAAEMMCAAVVLLRQNRRLVPPPLRRLGTIVLIYLCALFALQTSWVTFAAFRRTLSGATVPVSPWVRPPDSEWLLYLSITLSVLLASRGLILWRRWRRERTG